MVVPSRSKQIERVRELLDQSEDVSLTDLATQIVDGYHALLQGGIKKPARYPHVGMAFKTPFGSSVSHVAWTDGRRVWCVTATSSVGFLVPVESSYWDVVEESTAKAGAPGNNPKWNVGDKVSRGQRAVKLTVVATGDKCVLLQDEHGSVQGESNDSMKSYYRKEVSTEGFDFK